VTQAPETRERGLAPGVVIPDGGGFGALPPTTVAGSQPPAWPPLPPGVPEWASSYLNFLPGVYSADDFLGRFLLIFETILNPIERTVENIPHLFDPLLTPSDAIAWLGSWVGLVLDPRWPEARRRNLVHEAASLYHWRGTRHGLIRLVELYTGATPVITEPTLSQVAADRTRAYRFHVDVSLRRDDPADEAMIRTIIDLEKPAFAAYTLEIHRTS